MQIIREWCKHSGRCVIRTNTYANSLGHFNHLFEIAQKDFSELKASDVEIVHYAGERYARTFGIEFKPVGIVPKDYQEVARHEYSL